MKDYLAVRKATGIGEAEGPSGMIDIINHLPGVTGSPDRGWRETALKGYNEDAKKLVDFLSKHLPRGNTRCLTPGIIVPKSQSITRPNEREERMRITIPYVAGFSYPEKGYVDANKMQLFTEKLVSDELDKIDGCPKSTLLYICFYVDVPIKAIKAAMVVLECIIQKFPEYRPNSIFVNTLPSPALAIDIEFGNFRDIARAFI